MGDWWLLLCRLGNSLCEPILCKLLSWPLLFHPKATAPAKLLAVEVIRLQEPHTRWLTRTSEANTMQDRRNTHNSLLDYLRRRHYPRQTTNNQSYVAWLPPPSWRLRLASCPNHINNYPCSPIARTVSFPPNVSAAEHLYLETDLWLFQSLLICYVHSWAPLHAISAEGLARPGNL